MQLRSNFFTSLSIVLTIGLIGVGCTDNGAVRRADKAKAEAEKRSAEAENMKKDLDAKLKAAEEQAKANADAAAAIAAKIEDFESKVSERNLQLETLQKQVAAEQQVLSDIQAQRAELEKYIAEEKKQITEESNALAAAQVKDDAEKAEIARRQEILNQRKADLDELLKGLNEVAGRLEVIKANLEAREAAFADAVKVTKDLFAKHMIADVFDKVQANEEMLFLVHVIGFGSPQNVKMVREKIESARVANDKFKSHRTLSNLLVEEDGAYKQPLFVNVSDQILISAKAKDLRNVRDGIEAELAAQTAHKKVSPVLTSLWLAIRPVKEVELSLKMTVLGSTTKNYEGRKQSVLAKLNLGSKKIDVSNLLNVDLQNPGALLFEEARYKSACDEVTPECIATLKVNNLLAKRNLIQSGSVMNRAQQIVTSEDVLKSLLEVSIDQLNEDRVVEPNAIGIIWNRYGEADAKFKFNWLQFFQDNGATIGRNPVVEDIQVEYAVSALDTVSSVANEMDAMTYFSSGSFGRATMVDTEKAVRGEVSIPLPINGLKVAKSAMENLSLADYTVKTQIPAKPARLAAIEVPAPAGVVAVYDENYEERTRLNEKYQAEVRAAKEAIVQEQRKEFESRSNRNLGIISLILEKLK